MTSSTRIWLNENRPHQSRQKARDQRTCEQGQTERLCRTICDSRGRRDWHHALPEYEPTPLYRLDELATRLDIGGLWLKDESCRFGLNAFKGLGASWAVERYLREGGRADTFCTATEGNHGRALAWAARKTGRHAVIYLPDGTAGERIRSIEGEGARTVVVDGDYDRAIEQAKSDAQTHGWALIQDSAWPGYTDIPAWIMQGYLTSPEELEGELYSEQEPNVDWVILQAGVGSWAAAAACYFHCRFADRCPGLLCVEPAEADCVTEAVRQNRLSSSRGRLETIMAGLNCATASSIAWPVLRDLCDAFITVTDEQVCRAMRILYEQDPPVIAGPSGAAGVAALSALREHADHALDGGPFKLDAGSRVLVFNTEGDTDRQGYYSVVRGNRP